MATEHHQFENLLNYRDVSSLLSPPSKLKPGMLFRSARPDEATPADQAYLAKTITTIVDLRSPTEHLEQAKKLAAHRASASEPSSTVPSPRSTSAAGTAADLPKIAGIAYREVNFNGSAYIRSMLSQLSWPSYLRVLALYIAGYRVEAAQIIGTDVMSPRGVVGLMLDSLAVCTSEIATVFNDVLARQESYPVLWHCTQGKDRTGLVTMLTLFLLGVGVEDVQRDYMATQAELEPERGPRVEEIARIGLGPEWADCEPSLVEKTKKFLDERYGGVEEYLEHAGVNRETQQKIKGMLST
ncbi:protein-tyrosine phosphatase-like protein [Macrophomina phaseolina]|uniref:Protein-tyrosine phosphatase-like protein n=1 Tax=Macrophomina phaseolina TaxID=35725 RepID=A0ABQ8GQ98_9PEZI|nr:protein-tyrosine phosphatase-like protein [Macrophomina phaseolina]